MSDTKISNMTAGSPAVSTDAAHFARSGADVKLSIADICSFVLGQSAGITLPLATTNGGTGIVTYTVGDLIYGSGANVLGKLGGNTTTTKKILTQTGTGSASQAPVWGTLSATDISGLATVATSGSFADLSNQPLIFKTVAVAGQTSVLAKNTTDTLTFVAGTNVTLTTDNTANTITINSTGGGGGGSGSSTLAGDTDVLFTGLANNNILKYNSGSSKWVNSTISFAEVTGNGSANITTVGTITTGVWNGTVVDVAHGGTGAATFATNAVLVGAGTGPLVASPVTIDGVTGAVAGTRATLNPQSVTAYTLAAGDTGTKIRFTGSAAVVVTIANNLPVGFEVEIIQDGTGNVSFVAASGATLVNRSGHTKVAGQYGRVSLLVTANAGTAAIANLAGDTSA